MTAVQLALGVRPTSFLALREIRDRGLLGEMQLRVYETLVEHGPMTGMEVEQALSQPGTVRGSKHKRLPELARLGLVRNGATRPCRITGHLALTWEALDALPVEPPARPTKLQAFAAELRARLEREPGRTWSAAEMADLLDEMSGRRR